MSKSPNKTDEGGSSNGIYRAIDASRPQRYAQRCGQARSPSPDPKRSSLHEDLGFLNR
jgi:hypothetical protein